MPRRKYKKDVESDSEDSSPKPETRAKRKKRKVAGKQNASSQPRALLQSMLDMPVDVLLEIFKHLQLVDVMHLSRMSKPLRSILMSRTSISVWKQVIANDGLPQCTKDLNEPKLAELMFGRSCDWCGRNVSGQEIIWAARVRSCKRCIDLAYEQVNRSFEHYREYPPALAKHLPSVVVKNKDYIDIDLDREWSEQYRSKQSEDEKSKWLEARLAERCIITEHANACREWFKLRHENQVILRKAKFIERLRERGWAEELDKLGSEDRRTPTGLSEVVKACQSELTEPIMAALDATLDRFMETLKASRLEREKEDFFSSMLERLQEIAKNYSDTLPPDHIFPNTADIYFHPTVRKALSTVESDEALEEALARIQPSLPEIVEDCLKLSKQHLANLVIDEYTANLKSFDLSVLTLASTLFYCKCCCSDLTLDQTVAHNCRDTYYSYYSSPEDSDAKEVQRAIHEVTTPYKIQRAISFSLARLEPFTSILQSCGIDPNTTTTDMNAFNPVIECLNCSNVERGRVTMNWSLVTNHLATNRHCTHKMTLLDEPEAEIVRARMLEEYQKATAKSEDHICVHCRVRGGSMALMQHVKENHFIDSPVYGQDVMVSPSATTSRKEFCLWPPNL